MFICLFFNSKIKLNLDPPGKPSLTIFYKKNLQLDMKGVWLESQQYTVRCNSDPGNPPNKYRLIINGDTIHEGPEYTITAHKNQKVLLCDVHNKFTEDKTKPTSVYYYINVHCKSDIN